MEFSERSLAEYAYLMVTAYAPLVLTLKEQVNVEVMFEICFREILSSNLDRDTGYPN
jgi:hypothetical protein